MHHKPAFRHPAVGYGRRVPESGNLLAPPFSVARKGGIFSGLPNLMSEL